MYSPEAMCWVANLRRAGSCPPRTYAKYNSQSKKFRYTFVIGIKVTFMHTKKNVFIEVRRFELRIIRARSVALRLQTRLVCGDRSLPPTSSAAVRLLLNFIAHKNKTAALHSVTVLFVLMLSDKIRPLLRLTLGISNSQFFSCLD